MRILVTGPTGEKSVAWSGETMSIGRSRDNDIVLADFSVSRHHARLSKSGGFFIEDDQSTNGVFLNGRKVSRSAVQTGDEVTIGNFKLKFVSDRSTPSTDTYVRSLNEFQADYFPEAGAAAAPPSAATAAEEEKRAKVLAALVRMARTLLTTGELDEVLEKIMDVVFDTVEAERGYILLNLEGRLEPRLMRSRSGPLSKEELPFSRIICDQVIHQKVSLITHDAMADARFEEGKSILIHQIRAAMCAPLWNKDRVIGMIYVDSPTRVGTFTAEDLDILTALANFAAVALERAFLTRRMEDEKRIRTQLARYHSPAIVEQIIRGKGNTTSILAAAAVPDLTLLFADLAGFSTLSERMPIEPLTHMLNRFFGLASDCIFDQEGTLDKYIGDCVMAFFGAPLPQEDHADRAVRCAIALQRRVREWNDERRQRGEPPLQLRVGVHSGGAIVGDFGSMKRLEYTALGNTVNIASRLEQFVAEPGQIVLSGATVEKLHETYPLVSRGEFPLKGMAEKILVYQVEMK